MNDFHKPTKFPNEVFDALDGGNDPAEVSRVAHETANALLSRVRADPHPDILERLVRFTEEHGIDAVAELWSRARPSTLPGALWRIYLLQLAVRQDPATASLLFQRGIDIAQGIDPYVAGAENPAGPEHVTKLADRILRGLFDGDFAIALERAAAYCRITAAGAADIVADIERTEPQRAEELTARALRLTTMSDELLASARLWRANSLE